MNKKIKILHVLPTLSTSGGVQHYVYDLCKNLDPKVFDFDVISHNWRSKKYSTLKNMEKDFREIGCSVYELPDLQDGFFKFLKAVKTFFKEHHNYDIVHVHPLGSSTVFLYFAKLYNIPYRIFHAHDARYSDSPLRRIRNIPIVYLSKRFANHFLACTEYAGRSIFKNKNFEVIYPYIDKNKFLFSSNFRNKWRKKLGFNKDTFVIGFAGRLTKQKNPEFLLEIFNNFIKRVEETKLLICGDGPLEDKLKTKCEKLNISNRVQFLGNVEEVNQIYSAFDCFLMPSIYEGFGIVAVEAQFSGLKCLASNKVHKDVDIGNCVFLKLEDKDEWVNKLYECWKSKNKRFNPKNDSFQNNWKKLENYYKNLIPRL